jgi:Tfp pilus assembly protein PilP
VRALAVPVLLALLVVPCTAPVPAQEEPPATATDGEASQSQAKRSLMRDPFRPFTLDVRKGSPVQMTPLQRYEPGQLTVVATVWDVSPPRALLEDSTGMGYIVSLGTPIGRNGGMVTAIEPQRVVVEEHVLDLYGNERINRVVMETPSAEANQTERERK